MADHIGERHDLADDQDTGELGRGLERPDRGELGERAERGDLREAAGLRRAVQPRAINRAAICARSLMPISTTMVSAPGSFTEITTPVSYTHLTLPTSDLV